MTYRDIITSINYKIENSNFERFSTTQVVDELNNTYRDLANKTEAFETVDYMPLSNDIPTFTLPNRIYRPARAVYRGYKIDFVSQEAMDVNVPGWEVMDSPKELEYLVYNNMADRLVRVFPILTDIGLDYSDDDIQYLGQLSDVSDSVNVYLYLSTTTGAKYIADSQVAYGTVSDLTLTEVVTIYGSYLPKAVTESSLDTDKIQISEAYVNALIYGTAGNLLFTSGRTEDAAKAQNFMRLYGVDESEVGAIRNNDFTGKFRNTKRNTGYRTPFQR